MAMLHILRRWAPFALAATTLAALSPPALALDPGAAGYRFSSPYTHGNLTIFMIHGQPGLAGKPPITLQEAMQRGVVRVHETGSVNQLEVENLSQEAVFIQSGDIVKGGKQDRVLSVDLILPPRSGRVAIASFCVEQSRWTGRGKEDVTTFGSSATMLPSRDMKIAAREPLAKAQVQAGASQDRRRQVVDGNAVGASQDKVWRGVASVQEKLERSVGAPVAAPQSTSSLQLALENDRLKQASEAYAAALTAAIDKEPGAIGFIFAINGQINSAEIYGSPELFHKMWPKLLQATVIEAMAERKQGDSTPAPAPAVEALRAFLVDAETGKRTERELTASTTVELRDSDKAQLFEARQKDGRFVHRSYVAK